VIALIGLQLAMNAPFWALIIRVSVVGGSTGYHRYALIDATVRNFSEWFLVGVRSTGHWGWGLRDVTNMYVRVAVDGGLIGLVLFVSIIILSFRSLWRLLWSIENDKPQQIFLWVIAASLFTHTVSFYGVSYFSGQIICFWYMTVAMASTLGAQLMDMKPHAQQPTRQP